MKILDTGNRTAVPMTGQYVLEGLRDFLGGERPFSELLLEGHYSARLLFFLILIIGLNYLDACFTMMILEKGGRELNPIVQLAINHWGEKFWIWKFGVASFSSVILCLLSRFKGVKIAIVLITFIYLVLVSYQIIGLHIYNLP